MGSTGPSLFDYHVARTRERDGYLGRVEPRPCTLPF
jgi:hypothetical protein